MLGQRKRCKRNWPCITSGGQVILFVVRRDGRAGKNPAAVALARLRAASMGPEERRESARRAGLVGGRKRAEKLSVKRRSEIARKAAEARWRKKS
jgi:hypothetical protein